MTASGPPVGTDPGRPAPDDSIGSLVSHLTNDFGKLTRQELALAKAELRDEAKKAGKGAGLLGGAALAGWMVALFVSLTVMWALGEVMHLALAALIVTVLWGIAAAVMAASGRKELQDVSPKPDQTIESVKEDAKWLKTQNN